MGRMVRGIGYGRFMVQTLCVGGGQTLRLCGIEIRLDALRYRICIFAEFSTVQDDKHRDESRCGSLKAAPRYYVRGGKTPWSAMQKFSVSEGMSLLCGRLPPITPMALWLKNMLGVGPTSL